MKHLLDQPVWNALVSGNNNLSHGTSTAKYFDKSVAPFADLEDHETGDFKTLHEVVPGNQVVVMFSVIENLKASPWSAVNRIDGFQMIYDNHKQELTGEDIIQLLDSRNIPAMVSLTGLTNPGPFLEKTIDFGHYYGIFDNKTLVAMAGQRLHPNGFAEISAVCTHPDFTGKGLARQLVLHQIKRITENNETPFLHVKGENLNAIKLYQSIGFEIRTKIFFHILKK